MASSTASGDGQCEAPKDGGEGDERHVSLRNVGETGVTDWYGQRSGLIETFSHWSEEKTNHDVIF